MNTIRGKIISFFVLCFAFAGLLTLLYYEDAFSLRRKIYAIERFDDLLNDVLELRRYEKNFLFYRDTSNLKEGIVYLNRVDNNYRILENDIVDIIGIDESSAFGHNLTRYKQILDDIIVLNAGCRQPGPGREAPDGRQISGGFRPDPDPEKTPQDRPDAQTGSDHSPGLHRDS